MRARVTLTAMQDPSVEEVPLVSCATDYGGRRGSKGEGLRTEGGERRSAFSRPSSRARAQQVSLHSLLAHSMHITKCHLRIPVHYGVRGPQSYLNVHVPCPWLNSCKIGLLGPVVINVTKYFVAKNATKLENVTFPGKMRT